MNLAQLLVRAARVYPRRPALALGEHVVHDFAQLAARVAALAGGLRKLAIEPGARVALFMTNVPEYLEALLAAWWAGACVVPVNARLHPAELAYILADSDAALCIATPSHADGAVGAIGEARTVIVGSDRWRSLTTCEGSNAPMESAPTDLAWLFYTSGTTGRPKGVMLTHRNLLMMTLAYTGDVEPIQPGDSIIHAAPMSHGSGLYAVPHLAGFATQVVPESAGFDAAEVFALAKHWGRATLFAAPTMVKRLVDHARAHALGRAQLELPRDGADTGIKTIVYGGAPMYAADIEDALAVLGPCLAQIYGQGESPMTITALAKRHLADRSHPDYRDRIASVGVPFTGVEVRIADDEDRELPIGEVGEVLVRGDVVMAGYWRNAEATAATLRGGWLHTGDVGSLDEGGFLTLRDRSKDVIISGGSNIYPREVEEVLLRHAGVRECSVVGRRSEEWGEEVVAFVVRAGDSHVDAAELESLCLAHIARFKRPRQFHFVDELPKNNYGKVLKTELRRQLEN